MFRHSGTANGSSNMNELYNKVTVECDDEAAAKQLRPRTQSMLRILVPWNVMDKNELVLQGWMVKEGAVHKTWKRRWFRNSFLDLFHLKYFSDSSCTEKSFKGVIDLTTVTSWHASTGKLPGDKLMTGIIFRTEDRVWRLVAEGATASDYWTRGLKHLMAKLAETTASDLADAVPFNNPQSSSPKVDTTALESHTQTVQPATDNSLHPEVRHETGNSTTTSDNTTAAEAVNSAHHTAHHSHHKHKHDHSKHNNAKRHHKKSQNSAEHSHLPAEQVIQDPNAAITTPAPAPPTTLSTTSESAGASSGTTLSSSSDDSDSSNGADPLAPDDVAPEPPDNSEEEGDPVEIKEEWLEVPEPPSDEDNVLGKHNKTGDSQNS
ncbi:hypothetical protein Pelo_2051 [Pelomyxa schiedti]|nr:hypothetical protein Pelo_2051 [Pelomyxa schiedti]